MTSQNITTSLKQKTLGDTAVDGLITGLAAGLIMIMFLLVVDLINGISPEVVLGRFDVTQTNNMVTSFFTHLAVSAIYGVIFGLLYLLLLRLRPSLIRFGWLAGLLYGVILYGLVRSAPYIGVESELIQFKTVILLLAHAIYGLVLGILLVRNWQKAAKV